MIGVFDSGYGGLTILKELVKTLPGHDFVYLGDNARTPYGNRSREAVTRFTKQGVDFLFARGCRLIVIACFTASALALREIQEEYLRKLNVTDKKILGVLRPIAEEAVRISKKGRIGVVGTRGTIASGAIEAECVKLRPDVIVYGQACPLLVPLIEEHWYTKPEARKILRTYLKTLKGCNPDTLILGCTHYGIMIGDFRRMMGKKCMVTDSGKIIAASLKDYLRRHLEIASGLTQNGRCEFFTTDSADRFKEFTELFFGQGISNVESAVLE